MVAGWTENVKSYADESKFWASVWASLGEPGNGDIVERMKDSKRQYKYSVRRLKRVNDRIKNDRNLNSGGTNLFNEIKKFRGTSPIFSSRIDNEVGQKNIASHFANIYSELYNRVDLGDK